MKKLSIIILSMLLIVTTLTGCSSNKPKDETAVVDQKETVMLFDESKTYENEKLESGKIVAQDVTIKNTTFEQDLIIDKQVGEGNVFLDGVEIKGQLIVNGGGENSVHIDNSKVNSISSNRPDGKVRIVVSENTSVDNLEIASETKLEVQGEIKNLSLTSSSTGSVVEIKENAQIKKVDLNATVELSSKAPIGQLDIKAASKVNLEAPVTTVTVSSNAQNTAISLGKDAVVGSLATETKVDVSGDGKLQTVLTTDKTNVTGNIKADTTTVSTNPIQDTNKEVAVATPTPVATQTPRPATPNPTVVPTQAPTATPEPVAPEPTATPIPNYTISFVLPGYTVESQTVKQGNIASKPNITLDSSVIEGSYIVWLDENGKSFDFNSPISSNRTLKGEIAFKVIDESTLSSALSNPNINTIGLEANIDLGDQGIEVNKDLTIYGNNKTIESNIELNGVILVKESCLVKINEVNINATGNVSRGIYVDTDKNTTIEFLNSSIKSSDRGITFNGASVVGNTQQVNLLVKNSKMLNSKVTDYNTQVNYTTENASNAGNRGISLYDSVGTVNIENSEILGYKYSINISGKDHQNEVRDSLNLSVNNSTIKGWATFNVWGIHGEYTVKNSTLVGINNFTSGSNSFSTVVFNDDIYNIFDGNQAKFNKMIIENSTITNKQSQESIDSGVKQELIRVDCGLDEITFKGNVNLLDTSGNNTSAINISAMDINVVEDFIANKIMTIDARLTVTSNGKTIPLVISPFTTVNINNSQDLINAIANQKDMQIWKINSGNYDLTRNDTIEHLNQTGWFMPITANNIRIIGEGNPVITTSIDVENGNRSSQNLITIVGDNVSIDGVTIIAQRDPNSQIATNKAIEIFGDEFVLKNSVIKPHSDTSTYAGSIYLSNPGKKTTLNNVDMYYGRISTSGANNMSELVLNDVLIDYANSVLEEAPYYGFSNTTQTKVSAKNSILTVANITGADLTTQTNMLPIGMTIETKESTMGVKNLEVLYTEASENIVVKYDLPVGFLFDLPKVTDVEQLAGPYEKIFTGNEEEKSEAANIIGNDIIMYYYYKDSNNVIYPLLTVNGNALVKNKFWGGHLNYYNEDGRTTTKLETGSVIKDTYLGVKVPSHKGWTTSTNPSVDPATVSTGWLNAAKGNEVFVTIAVIYNGRVKLSTASVQIPAAANIINTAINDETMLPVVDEEEKELVEEVIPEPVPSEEPVTTETPVSSDTPESSDTPVESELEVKE